MEESTPDETQGGRARRNVVDSQGGFAIGVKKEKRVIEPYKYWRVDNKEKNKKRKMMAGKLWKGRKRPKLDSLTPDEEVGLKIENHSEYPSMASIYSLTFCVKVYLSELIAAEDGDEDCAEQERYICSLKYAWSNI